MKKTLGLIVIIALLTSFNACKKEKPEDKIETVCDVENPLEDLVWLKEIKTIFDIDMSPQMERILHFKYNDADVFYIQDCYNCSDALDYVMNCEGERICEFGSIVGLNTCPDFEDEAVLIEILYEQ